MNIRQRIIETYVPSYRHKFQEWGNVNAPTWWNPKKTVYKLVDRETWIQSKTTTETKLEYLNPETSKWEPIPTVREEFNIPKKCVEQGCC
jgi:hypothetical protein